MHVCRLATWRSHVNCQSAGPPSTLATRCMGRITVFVKDRCKYCEKVKAYLQAAVDRHGELQTTGQPGE